VVPFDFQNLTATIFGANVALVVLGGKGAGGCGVGVMALLWGSFLAIFIAGIVIGYGVRAVISSRRRAEIRRRYEVTGSYRQLV
jgi:hypothetical protein